MIGASSAKRWLNCTASNDLILQLPYALNRETKESREGTDAHEVAEALLTGDYEELTESDKLEHARVYQKVIQEAIEGSRKPSQVFYEDRVHYPSLSDIAFGTCDAWFMDIDTLHVFDYKYGMGVPVDAFENEQTLYYANAIMETHTLRKIKSIVHYIIQPRLDHISIWRTDIKGQKAFTKRAIKALTGEKVFKMGEHCTFCPAKLVCPEYLKALEEAFEANLSEEVNMSDPALVTPERLNQFLNNADVLKKWIKSVEDYAIAYLEDDQLLDDWNLQPKVSNRKWVDEELAFNTLKGTILDESVLVETKLKSPAKIEKLDENIGSIVSDLVIREVTGVKLNRVKREKLKGKALTAAYSKK